MLVLFSVYLEELDFYLSNQADMKRVSVLAFIQEGETEMYREKERHTSDAG